MELKKIFIFFLFINFASNLNAEILKPDNKFTPYDVVKIQLNALKNNDNLKKDLGKKQVWLFAHPENKKITGPYNRFRAMIFGDQYRHLLNHTSHKINLVMNTANKYIYKVNILTMDKQIFVYEWHLIKGSDLQCKDCWFTSSVSMPFNQGNTI
jgi:hypothetical protein